MSFNLSAIPNASTTCYEYSPETRPGFSLDPDTQCFRRLSPLTDALIRASYALHLPILCSSTQVEWLTRLSILFAFDHSFLLLPTNEGRVPVPITASDLLTHLGLTTDASFWTSARFSSFAYAQFQLIALSQFHSLETTHALNQDPPHSPH